MLWRSNIKAFDYAKIRQSTWESKNKPQLNQYIHWATDQAKRTSTPEIYQFLTQAYQLLDEHQKAQMVKNEANYLFAKSLHK